MHIAYAFLLIGSSAVFAAEPFPNEAKAHGWRMLDAHPRARAYASWYTIPATKAQFRKMQHQYRPQDFDVWTKRLRQLRPGMTEKQVIQILQPKEMGPQLAHSGSWSDTIVLNDAYFAEAFFDERTRRMISATPTPLAITYEIKADQNKPPKT